MEQEMGWYWTLASWWEIEPLGTYLIGFTAGGWRGHSHSWKSGVIAREWVVPNYRHYLTELILRTNMGCWLLYWFFTVFPLCSLRFTCHWNMEWNTDWGGCDLP